jgi:hypothetical protein
VPAFVLVDGHDIPAEKYVERSFDVAPDLHSGGRYKANKTGAGIVDDVTKWEKDETDDDVVLEHQDFDNSPYTLRRRSSEPRPVVVSRDTSTKSTSTNDPLNLSASTKRKLMYAAPEEYLDTTVDTIPEDEEGSRPRIDTVFVPPRSTNQSFKGSSISAPHSSVLEDEHTEHSALNDSFNGRRKWVILKPVVLSPEDQTASPALAHEQQIERDFLSVIASPSDHPDDDKPEPVIFTSIASSVLPSRNISGTSS